MVTQAERVLERRLEDVVFFESDQLPAGPTQDDLVVKLIVLPRWRVVEHVVTGKAVFIRKLMVDTAREVVFAGNRRTGEGIDACITRDGTVGHRVKAEIGEHSLINMSNRVRIRCRTWLSGCG